MASGVKESDWKLYSKRLPEWQERWMEKLNCEYAATLAGSELASEKFWKLADRIKVDKRATGVICERRRSRMDQQIMEMLLDGVITMSDLEGFSEELVEGMRSWLAVRERLEQRSSQEVWGGTDEEGTA